MKIGIDARMYGPKACTGIGQYIRQLTNQLFNIDQENQYFLFLKKEMFDNLNSKSNSLYKELDFVNKILADVHWYTYKEQFKLPWILYREKLDLMHFTNFNLPILYRKPFVVTVHDITPFFFPGHKAGKSKWRKWGYDAVFKHAINKSKKIIAVSQSTKDLILKNFKVNLDKIKVIYEGVDEKFKPIADCGIINAVKTKYGLDKPFIFFVGVWRNHKNVAGLVKVFDILKKKYKWQGNLVLGGQEDAHYLEVSKTIKSLGLENEIIRPGFISDEEMPVFYSLARAFVNPSLIEGFGLNNLEAHACGCPVVSSSATSLPEVSGQAAVYFNPNNIKEMAEKIYQVISDENLRQSLRQKGFEQAKKFSWEKCAKETLEVYKQSV